MLDFKDYCQLVGILQMSSSEEEMLSEISKHYRDYLSKPKEEREAFEKGLLQKNKHVIVKLYRMMRDADAGK